MRLYSNYHPIPDTANVRQVDGDERVGIWHHDARPAGLPGLANVIDRPIGLFFTRIHADHGYRDEIRLSVDEAAWIVAELVDRIRQLGAVAPAYPETVAGELEQLRADAGALAARIGQCVRALDFSGRTSRYPQARRARVPSSTSRRRGDAAPVRTA
jgi:hypothetical protein